MQLNNFSFIGDSEELYQGYSLLDTKNGSEGMGGGGAQVNPENSTPDRTATGNTMSMDQLMDERRQEINIPKN